MKQFKLTDNAVQTIVEKARSKLLGMQFAGLGEHHFQLVVNHSSLESDLEPSDEWFAPGDLVIFRGDVRIVKRVNDDGTVLIGQLQKDRFLDHTVPAYCLKSTDHTAQVKG